MMSRRSSARSRVEEELARTRQFFDKGRSVASRSTPVQDYIFAMTSKLIPRGRTDLKAVDLGCHWGRYTRLIAETYGDVVGVDFSENALATAEKGPNISYVSMDLNSSQSRLSALAPVDFFFANAVLEMLEEPGRLCRQLAACGSESAVVLALIPNRRSLNYVTFRAALWVATRLLGKRGGIYNNGISSASLAASLEAAGFGIEERGAIIGVPAYLLGLLPARAQTVLLKLDGPLLRLLGGSYHWVRARKTRPAGARG